MKHYKIGSLDILIDPGPIELSDSLHSVDFISDEAAGSHALYIRAEEADLTFLQDWEVELYTGMYEIRRKGERRFLLHHWMTYRFAFGLYLEELFGQGDLQLYCAKLPEPICLTAAHFLGAVGIHHRLLQKDCAVIHASYIAYKGKGILFTAPSQTGKSTQAELWQHYAGAEILNGDRALLFCKDGCWFTGGYIACGSSGLCRNRILPLGAVVLLAQGKENVLRPASGKEIIRSLLFATETFHWSTQDLDLALAMAGKAADRAPVFHLSCRPDKAAVLTLKRCLEADTSC